MKIEFDKEKSAKKISSFVQGTVDFSKKTAADAKAGVSAMLEKSKLEEHARKLKRYNPLFPEQYQKADFHLPNIVAIVDDAVRRGIDVCEGAIGWLGNNGGEEVLYLYDEAVDFSGLTFIPAPICNAVYSVDPFNRQHFIQADCIFSRTLKEKIDELQHIADFLGAKRCLILISEAANSSASKKNSIGINAKLKGSAQAMASMSSEEASSKGWSQYGRIEAEFCGDCEPKRPTVKWFVHDDSIQNLIENCCSGKRRVQKMTLELAGSTFATMSQATACAIDGVFHGLKVSGNASMQSQAKDERESKLLFEIEF